ncbi:diacylglycerol kinase (ATP) [Neisseria sp. HSC-16F19]|nr:diacylglycerol kinase [Neisseria sp. HSC-16F19]MCP2040290.1 diacylglycerol kinase (ATP) [Neisseria sp. HSC-16F19]
MRDSLPPPQDEHYAARMKGRAGIRRIVQALGYSWHGVRAACEEAGFRELLWINAVLLVLALWLPFETAVRLVLILVSFLTLVVELINTAVEAAVDHTSQAEHPLAKRAKDAASAALYLLLAALMVLWLVALYDVL